MEKIVRNISVVTPTYLRPDEVGGLLENLAKQSQLPTDVIVVDGAPADDKRTEVIVASVANKYPFKIRFIRHAGGTAIQRNAGIEAATGDFVAFIDDDVRLEPDFFLRMLEVFGDDGDRAVGGAVGYRTNQHFSHADSERWRWYRRLRLLTTYEPGRYDFETGYPINNNMQPPFAGTRPVDFMTTACAVWRKDVFGSGLRFDPFFRDYGVLEDAHFALRARRNWELVQCGDARCEEMRSPNGRVDRRMIGFKCVVNYYYVFRDSAGPLTSRQKFRFWRYQAFEFFRIAASALRRQNGADLSDLRGRLDGYLSVIKGTVPRRSETDIELSMAGFSTK